MLARAFRTFLDTRDRPTLIIVDSHIAYGAPNKQDTSAAHGEPLGEEEIRLTKRNYGWPEDAKFLVPDGVYEHFRDGIGKRGKELRDAWFARVKEYRAKYPELADAVLPACSTASCRRAGTGTCPPSPPTRREWRRGTLPGRCSTPSAKNVPWLMGGSADLGPSCKTRLTFDGAGDFSGGQPRRAQPALRHPRARHGRRAQRHGPGQGAGLRLHVPDLQRLRQAGDPAQRLMELPVVYVFTHDSIGVGEDGPTHQPVEQVASLRAIPGLIVLRPADANEVVEAWKVVMKLHHEPAVLVLTRQAVPTIDRGKYAAAAGLARGAYVLADAPDGKPDVLLLATGSEVALCLEAYETAQGGGDQGAGGEHAVVGAVRRPAAGVPRPRAAAGGDGARLGGAGVDVRLGASTSAPPDTASACGPSGRRPR